MPNFFGRKLFLHISFLVGIYCSLLHNIQASVQEEMSDLESLLEYNEIVKKLFANEDEEFQLGPIHSDPFINLM